MSIVPLFSQVDTADVSSTAIGELRKISDTSCSTNSAWATVGMNSRVLVFIVMEPSSLGLSASENGAALAEN